MRRFAIKESVSLAVSFAISRSVVLAGRFRTRETFTEMKFWHQGELWVAQLWGVLHFLTVEKDPSNSGIMMQATSRSGEGSWGFHLCRLGII